VAPSRRQQTGECDLLLFPISAYRINSCMKEKATANVLYELETALHKNEVRSSPQAVAALLADDFITNLEAPAEYSPKRQLLKS
jgi:hypothetical protein